MTKKSKQEQSEKTSVSVSSKAKFKGGGRFARYRAMVISLAILLFSIVGLLYYLYDFYENSKGDYAQIYTTTRLETEFSNVVKNVYGLEHINPAEVSAAPDWKAIDASMQVTGHALAVIKDGGTYTDIIANTTQEVGKISSRGKDERIVEMSKRWGELVPVIQSIRTATSPEEASANLERAHAMLKANNAFFSDATTYILTDEQSRLNEKTNNAERILLIGVIVIALYFILFLFIFIRRMLDADNEAEEAKQETTEIMNTVTSGLFLLDKDLKIGSQYSKQVEILLGRQDVGGQNLLDVLGSLISHEDLNTTYAFIGQLYNPRTKERLIGSLNPLMRQKVTINNKERFLDFNFRRIYHDKTIARVLVNVEDVTDAVLLEAKMEQEREQNDIQLEMLSTILQADRSSIIDFVDNTNRHIQNINGTLKSSGESETDLYGKVNAIFREVHSMKGEASALKLNGFTVMAENLENSLHKLKQTPKISGEHFLGLAVQLEELIRLNQTIDDLVSRIAGQTPVTPVAAAQPATAGGRYASFVHELAERNHKEVAFSYNGLEKTGKPELDNVINEIAIQLLRNSVVHGIETADVRTQRSKLPAGLVRMSLQEQNDKYVLTLEDDGNGIDYDAIARKAVRIGKYSAEEAKKLDKRALVALLFSPGFSTLETSNEDAGRGVGLDIIKDRIVALGGSVSIASKLQAYTRFSFTLPKNKE